MLIRRTMKVERIDEETWRTLNDEGTVQHGCVRESPDYLHVITDYTDHFDVLYAGVEFYHPDDDCLFYRANLAEVDNFGIDEWSMGDLLYIMSKTFLGADPDTVREDPARFVGLPFWSLIAFNDYYEIFPPHLIAVLNADFNNVETDGEAQKMRDYLRNNHPHEGLHDLYQQLRVLVHDSAIQGSTFRYEEAPTNTP